MKAYRLSIKDFDEAGMEIVFANTAKEAKKQAYGTEMGSNLENWTDLRVNRDKRYDGMEKLSGAELACKQWRDGWQWEEYNVPDPDEATDAEFQEWYEKTFTYRPQ